MTGTPFWDRVFSTASWLLCIVLAFSAVSLWTVFTPVGVPPGAALVGPVGALGGGKVAIQLVYTVLYAGQSILLAYSKLMKRKNMRKHVLLFIYLTGFFTMVLSALVGGFSLRLVDNVLVSLVAAGCWLYWKFKTEYISIREFEKDIGGLRPR